MGAEVQGKRPADLRFVVDDEDAAHGESPSAANWQGDDHGQASTGCVVEFKPAVHRLYEALGDRHAQTDTVGRSIVTQLLEWCGHPRGGVVGIPGPRSMMQTWTSRADRSGGQTDGRPAPWRSALMIEVLETSLEQRGIAIGAGRSWGLRP